LTTKSAAHKEQHPWSKEALLAKAQRYAEEMLKHPRDDWRFGLWSTFALELLGRAALAKFSPCLVADAKDWNNLYFGLGFQPKAAKFIPKSIDVTSIFSRLREIIPEFTSELEGFSALHMNQRNEELHSGLTPFDSLKATWLPTYYLTCTVLLTSLGESLDLLIGPEEATIAIEMIKASRDESAKAIMKSIAAHKTIWETKETAERDRLSKQAIVWARRHVGHRATCPACGNDALVYGTPTTAPLKALKEDLITITQQYLPTKFECVACQLKISGLSHLSACGLGNTFKSTTTFDAADYYAPNDDFAQFEDDNNEP